MWTDEQIDHWRIIYGSYTADTCSADLYQDFDRQRQLIQSEMIQLLNSFLDGAISLKEFNTIFQQRTHDHWRIFHLRGMSGGLFLNKLVKYVPDEETFAHLLRMMLHVPEDRRDGQQQMWAFLRFLEGLITSQQTTRFQVQPARIPFFLSAWWHIQAPERWPIFYFDMRCALSIEEEMGKTLQNPIEAYFEFRERFISLTKALGITSWKLEYCIKWRRQQVSDTRMSGTQEWPSLPVHRHSYQQLGGIMQSESDLKVSTYVNTVNRRSGASHKKERGNSCRTHLQWLLARIGLKVGCQVWIAAGDHSKIWENETLGDLSLPSLAAVVTSDVQRIMGQIDVVWFRKNEVVAAYEIEPSAKNIANSLLCLSDLGVLLPKRDLQFYMVASRAIFEQIQQELSRPTFQKQEIRKRCKFISEESLILHSEHILRWASSPVVIHDLVNAG